MNIEAVEEHHLENLYDLLRPENEDSIRVILDEMIRPIERLDRNFWEFYNFFLVLFGLIPLCVPNASQKKI